MNNPLVSVVVPVFNREAILAETVNSVLDQQNANIELLLIDDGSTDRSLEISKQFAEHDPRVKVIPRIHHKKGAPVCRNIGLDAAQGQYIIFLDSDDLLATDAIEKRMAAISKDPALDFIVNPSVFFSVEISDANTWWNVFDDRSDLDRFLLQDVVWQTAGPTWNRSFLLNNNLRFNEEAETSQDWEFHLRCLMLQPKYIKMPVPDSFIRRGSTQDTISSKHFSPANQLNRIALVLSILESLRDSSLRVKMPLLVSKLVEEYIMQLNSKQSPSFAEAEQFFREALKLENRLSPQINYLKTGTRLFKMSPFLYKIYRKFFFRKIFVSSLYPASKYRTPITPDELRSLPHLLNKMPQS